MGLDSQNLKSRTLFLLSNGKCTTSTVAPSYPHPQMPFSPSPLSSQTHALVNHIEGDVVNSEDKTIVNNNVVSVRFSCVWHILTTTNVICAAVFFLMPCICWLLISTSTSGGQELSFIVYMVLISVGIIGCILAMIPLFGIFLPRYLCPTLFSKQQRVIWMVLNCVTWPLMVVLLGLIIFVPLVYIFAMTCGRFDTCKQLREWAIPTGVITGLIAVVLSCLSIVLLILLCTDRKCLPVPFTYVSDLEHSTRPE
jgi:hypothetical protein